MFTTFDSPITYAETIAAARAVVCGEVPGVELQALVTTATNTCKYKQTDDGRTVVCVLGAVLYKRGITVPIGRDGDEQIGALATVIEDTLRPEEECELSPAMHRFVDLFAEADRGRLIELQTVHDESVLGPNHSQRMNLREMLGLEPI